MRRKLKDLLGYDNISLTFNQRLEQNFIPHAVIVEVSWSTFKFNYQLYPFIDEKKGLVDTTSPQVFQRTVRIKDLDYLDVNATAYNCKINKQKLNQCLADSKN